MDSMGSMDMGGMDSSSAGVFKPTNMYIARVYWYIVAAFVALLGLIRLFNASSNLWIKRTLRHHSTHIPSRPQNLISQWIATVTAVIRESSYPQPVYFIGRWTKFFTPPPLGECLLLLAYWVILLCMLFSNTILSPDSSLYAYKWEIVGFRAAWVSVTQLPLIYLLSCKISPLTLITGITAERLNWFHRWAARTMFLTVAVHWSYFYREWYLGGIVDLEFSMMPMVKYGFGAWAILGWFILSGFGLFRQQAFEIFILQHIAGAAVLLWLVWVHVPSYASYNVWLSIAFLGIDWTQRFLLAMWRNTSFLHRKARDVSHVFGYSTEATAMTGGYVMLKIKDVNFSWKAGQHLHISIPRIGLFQSHPFTIMSVAGRDGGSVELFIKAHRGMTKRLYSRALRLQEHGHTARLHAFVNGPWGNSPALVAFDTVVFVATSTGISYTLPLFRELCSDRSSAARRIHFHWTVRHLDHVEMVREQLNSALEDAFRRGVEAQVTVHLTRDTSPRPVDFEDAEGSSSSTLSRLDYHAEEKAALQASESFRVQGASLCSTRSSTQSGLTISPMIGRPCLDGLLRRPIEHAIGETAVIGCGGREFSAQLRNYVSAISDERAVHKGTGAQGIFLHVENYGL